MSQSDRLREALIEALRAEIPDLDIEHAEVVAAQADAILARLRAAAPVPDERQKRLQSAHHRMLMVTAVTCEACRKERARATEPTDG